MKSPAPTEDLAAIVNGARPRHPVLKWAIILGVIAAAGGAWFFFFGRSGDKSAPTYTTETVKRGDLSLKITATGNLEPTNQVTVGSEISGLILEVLVDSNDRVEKGQPLAKIDTTKLSQQADRTKATLLSAQARVALAEATLKENEASLKRREELHKLSGGQTPSKADMDATIALVARSKAEVASANASVAESEATLRTNQTDLSKAIIKSPVSGIVLKRSVEPGQTVAAQFTAPELFILAEKLERMELQVAVAEADIGRVEKGQPATFTVDAYPDRTFKAEVKKVSFGSEVLNNVVTYDTELDVPNDDNSLRPGMTATADIDVGGKKNVLIVPNAALRFDPSRTGSSGQGDQNRTLVQSLTPGGGRGRRFGTQGTDFMPVDKENPKIWTLRDGKPVAIPVKVGMTDGRHTEVSGEGVEEGLAIIISARVASPS
ncbi:MAG TPA: efflux RND transporter periplasmic adaptor subunit [Verrucomicrobiales bacterium]|nr:efflux RND transporter periplasmic adaptor subunit [Verrucomicrobiales bacterium]